MTILLTGGTGFLGNEFLETCHKKNQIIATYRDKPGRKFSNVAWIKLDLTQKADFDAAFKKLKNKKIDAVVHIGGASPNRAYSDGNFDATTQGTKNLLALAKKLHVRKFIFISSVVVTFPYHGPYADSKRLAEKMIKKAGLTYTIFQPETIIGKDARDFNRLVAMLGKRKIFPIIGSGKNLIQPIASVDLIKMITISLHNKKTDNKTYIAVGKDIITTRQFLTAIAKKLNKKIIFLRIPLFLAYFIAEIANKINPRWGLNRERIYILTHSRQFPGIKNKINGKYN